jgi:hypothetical protein
MKIVELARKAGDIESRRLCIDVPAKLGETSREQPDRIQHRAHGKKQIERTAPWKMSPLGKPKMRSRSNLPTRRQRAHAQR